MKRSLFSFIRSTSFLLLFVMGLQLESSAQSPSAYAFTPSSGTFTPITGTAFTLSQLAGETAGINDDGIAANMPIGFNFNYNGTTFTTFNVTTNGCMSLGTTPSTAWWGNSLDAFGGTPKINFLAPLWDDNNITGGTLSYSLTGTPGTQILTVEWLNSHIGGTGSATSPTASFQVKLFEGTNVVQFVYGGTSAALTGTSASIGITGAVGNFLSVTPAATATVSSTTANNSVSSATNLPSGTIYTFTPPPPCVAPTAQPTSLLLTAGVSVVNGSFTAAAPTADKYLVVRTPGTAPLSTPPVNATTYTVGGTLGNGTIVSYASNTTFSNVGLTGNTTFTYTIFTANDLCTGGPLYNTAAPLTGTIATSAPTAYVWNATTGTVDGSLPGSWTPARNVPDPTDTLYFSNGGSSTITNLATSTVAKIAVRNNTSIIANSAATTTLTIGKEFSIASGSTLDLSGTNGLTIAFSSTNAPQTGTIDGTLNLSGTGTSSYNAANSVTTVGTTGVVNVTNGGALTGAATTLFFGAGSVYNHGRNGGTIPAAAYNVASTVKVTGTTTTASTPPVTIGGNVEWNSPLQTLSAASWTSTATAIGGSFTMISTGTGSFQFGTSPTMVITGPTTITGGTLLGAGGTITMNGGLNISGGTLSGTTATTLNVNGNFTQTGGTISSSSATANILSFNITGNVSQTAGSITQSGTGSFRFTFNGTASQSISFGTMTGLMHYVLNNPAGAVLTGALAINNGGTNTVTNGSWSGSGSFAYNATASTLVYNGANAQTTANLEFPSTNGPTALTINNTSSAGVTLHAARTLTTALTLTTGKLNTSVSNLLTLSAAITAPPAGSATSYVNGPLALQVNSAANLNRTFAIGDAVGYRPVTLSAFHSGGALQTYTARVISGATGGTGTGINLNTSRYFQVSNIGTIGSTTTPTILLGYGGDDVIGAVATAVIGQSATANGTYANRGQSANTASSVTSSTATPITAGGGEYFVIGNTASVPKSWDGGAGTTNWADANNWAPDGVPSCTEDVIISAGAIVDISASAQCQSLAVGNATINSNASSNLTVGCATPTGGNKLLTFISGSTLNLAAGTIHVNGGVNFQSGSTFNQSGGLLEIDPNDGTAAGSLTTGSAYLTGTNNLNCSAGTIRIIDPLYITNTAGYAVSSSVSVTAGTYYTGTHTIELGDGVSSTPGGTNGFRLYSFAGAGYAPYRNIIIKGGSAAGRWAAQNSLALTGTLTVNPGSEFRHSTTSFFVGGNLVNNGKFASTSTITFGPAAAGYTIPAGPVVSGTGTWRNTIPTITTYTTAGTGYAVGDVVTLVGGTFTTPASFVVTTVNGTGGITAATVVEMGSYTVAPTAPVSVTGGTGTGAAFTLQATTTNVGYLIPSANLVNITTNNTNGATFSGNVSYSGTLTFTLGKVFMGSNSMIQIAGASIASNSATTGWVVGKFRKNATPGGLSHTFPIGDATYYTPVVLSGAAGAVTAGGDIEASTVTGDHPSISTSTLNAAKSVNRYYFIDTLNGITFAPGAVTAAVNWNAADVDAGVNAADLIAGFYDGTAWTIPTVATPTATSIQITGIGTNPEGAYQVAELLPVISNNTIAAAQVICSGQAPALLTGSTPTGGTGTYSYIWQGSTTSATAGFTNATGTNNGINYAPGALTQDTWYRRVVVSGSRSDTSAAIAITVNPTIANNTVSAAQSICSGSTPAALTGTTPTGGSGTYTYAWESSTTSATTGFGAATGTANGIDYTPGALTATTWYRRTVTSGGCTDVSTAIAITVNPAIANNTVSAAQSICSGSTPAALTGTTPTGGSGTYTYAWESSTTSATTGFGAAAGTANASGYTPGALTATTWYRRTVTSGGCTDVSTAIAITVNPAIANNTVSAAQSICSGSTPAALTGTTPTGGSGTYTYAWESSTTSATTGFGAAAGTANASGYTPGALTATTWYRRTVTSGGCTDVSTAIAITVNPAIANNTVSAAQSICSGSTPAALTGTTPTGGSGTYTYAWESSTTSATTGFGAAAGTANASGYTPGALTATTWYRRTVTSGGCTDVSTAIAITVNPAIANNTVSAAQSICSGSTPAALTGTTPTGGSGTYTYAWESSTTSATTGFGAAAGTANASGYTPGALTATTWYRRTVTSGGCTDVSTAIAITVNPAIANNTVSAAQSICSGSTPAALTGTTPTGGSGTYTYAWESSTTSATAGFGAAAGTANASGYTPGALTANTWYRRTVTSGGCSNTSTAIQITTVQPASITTQPATTVAICSGNTILLSVAASNASGYTWYKGATQLTNTGNVSGANTANLRIVNATTTDNGTYSVRVASANAPCGEVISGNSVVTVNSMSNTLAPTGTTSTYTQIDGITNTYADGSCRPIVKVVDASGGNTLGSVTTTVTVDATVQTTGGQPFLQRHYLITPASNGSATVTLYATQPEFTAYNAAAGSNPLMPTGGVDNGNVRVTKFTGSAPAAGTGTLITPTVSWNATNSWWEITFPVTSFSSFYIHTGNAGPLEIDLRDISAVNAGKRNRVDWSTANETGADRFEVEKSLNGRDFTYLGVVKAKGQASGYSYWDETPANGLNYYRLKMFNVSGSSVYSKTVTAFVGADGSFTVSAYPNPIQDKVTVKLHGSAGANGMIHVTDMSGKLIQTLKAEGAETSIDMTRLAQGVYFIRYSDDMHSQTLKVNKQ